MKSLLFLVFVEICLQIRSQRLSDQCKSYTDIIDTEGTLTFCKLIQNGCRTCNDKECVSCLDGFYLYQQQCKSCKDVFGDKVDKCQFNLSLKKPVILSCIQGYFYDTISLKCSECSSLCSECTNSTQCTKCFDQAYLSNSKCLLCDKSLTNNCCYYNNNKCEVCLPGYFLQSGSCIQCIPSCAYCSDGTCSECKSGYFYDQAQNLCVQNPNNCKKACITTKQSGIQQLRCVQCNDKTLLNNDMYYPDQNGICNQVCSHENCLSCNNKQQCLICKDGYTLMQYQSNNLQYEMCFECQSNCNRCQMQGKQKVCYECKDQSAPNSKGQCLQKLIFSQTLIVSQFSPIVAFLSIQSIIYLIMILYL